MFGRAPPQPPRSMFAERVPGPVLIQLISNKSTVTAEVWKYLGNFYGKIAQPNGNFKPNIVYKVIPIKSNPPTFQFIPTNAAEYELVKGNRPPVRNAAGRITNSGTINKIISIRKKTNNPLGANKSAQQNFEQWWTEAKGLGNNATRAGVYLGFVNMIQRPVPNRKQNEEENAYKRRVANNTKEKGRFARITTVTPLTDPEGSKSRKPFWDEVQRQIAAKQPTFRQRFMSTWKSVWNTFPNIYGQTHVEERRKLGHGKFTQWYLGVMSKPPANRAAAFRLLNNLPPKGNRNKAAYALNANVVRLVPRQNGENNETYANRVATMYNYKNITGLTEQNNKNLNNSKNKANSVARANFWRAVRNLNAVRAAAAGAGGAGV